LSNIWRSIPKELSENKTCQNILFMGKWTRIIKWLIIIELSAFIKWIIRLITIQCCEVLNEEN
ncbi:MAG: hypothetical protein ACYCYC_06185, partial [Bellilinea sp.]